jgi:prephenate dehydrogenase
MLPFARVAIVGMGLIGSSLARAIRARMPTVRLHVSDADPVVRDRVIALDLADAIAPTGTHRMTRSASITATPGESATSTSPTTSPTRPEWR